MVHFRRGSNKGDRSMDAEWHEIGDIARTRTSSPDEWSEIEKAKYDLEDPSRKPTGKRNPRTWKTDKPLLRVNPPDPGESARYDPRDDPRK